jgi:hypothetical protein
MAQTDHISADNARAGHKTWFPRIRAARPGGALVRYDIGSEMKDLRSITDEVERARRMLTGPVIGRD